MEISVARFKCSHPNCTGRGNNDYSVQTIYEHIGQHLFQDTGAYDHFDLHCTCGDKFHFALLPYATAHLDQHKHQLDKHQIRHSSITLADVEASKRILAYQKRFIMFSGYKMERDICPALPTFPLKEGNVLHQAVSSMNAFQPDPYANRLSNNGKQYERRDREMSPVNVRTPIYGRSPSPTGGRQGSRTPARYDKRGSPRSNRGGGGFNSHELPSPQRERRSGGYSPPQGRFNRGGFDRGSTKGTSFGHRDQHDRRSPAPQSPQRRRFDRGAFGRDSEVRSSYGRQDSKDIRSAGSPQRGRSDRGRFGYNSDRGRSFGNNDSRDGDRRPYNDRGGFGRGRGRGRGSDENGPGRFGGRHVDNINSHMGSNGDNGGRDGPDGPHKRQREGLSPRSSDDESQKGEPNARRVGNPANKNLGDNSKVRINGFKGENEKQKAAGKPAREGTSPRSSDDDDDGKAVIIK